MKDDNSQPKNYFPALDGLRGVLAIGVITAHVKISWFPGAPIMMEIFFLISGFLITGIIMRTVEKTGRVGLLHFWKRRLMRLYPVMLTVVFSTLAVGWLILDESYRPAILKDAIATIFYYSNWTKLYDYHLPTFYGQSWSLSIEEQFYILWPTLFAASIAFGWSRRQLFFVLFLIALASVLWRNYLIYDGAPWSRLYYALETRMDAFVFGAMLALSYERLLEWTQSASWQVVLNLCALALTVILITGSFHDVDYFKWRQTLTLILTGATVLLLSAPRESFLKRIFCASVFMYIGRRSYSIYLWHWPIIWILFQISDVRGIYMALIVLPLTMLLSILSYNHVEMRFMSQKRRVQNATKVQ